MVSTATDTEYRHNIIADGEVIAVHTITGTGAVSTSYLHYDHLGSVDAITDDSGNVIQAMSFDAFGLRRDVTNWDYDLSQNTIATLKNYTDRGYTDQEQLDNLSLVDLNGRVYDPTVGRMISADPTVPAPFYGQAFNRFAYVYDSPLVNVDPTGLGSDPCQGKIVEAINVGGSSTRAQGDACPLGPVTVTGTPVPPPSLNSTNTTSTPGNGQQPGANNGPDPGKNPNNNPNNNPKQPQQKPKQQPKQNCNQNLVNIYNRTYTFGDNMVKAGLAGAALAGITAETPTPYTEAAAASLTAASAVVGGLGLGVQAAAGWELYKQTGNITPYRNSVVGISQSLVNLPEPAGLVAATAMSSALGQQKATCPSQ